MKDGTGARKGFTMVELMVVISVIVVLLAMLLAGIQRVREMANRTQCANNLRQIGYAYLNYIDKMGDPAALKANYTWVTTLRPYLDGRDDIYYCPSAENRGVLIEEVPKAWIRVQNRTFDEYGGSHDIPFSKNSGRMRVSSRYPQDDPPGSYVLEMEDHTDFNWRDLDMRVSPSADGMGFTVTALASGAGFNFDLVGPDGNIVVPNFKPNYNPPPGFIPGGSSRTSYGLSSQVPYLAAGDADKVLAVEYSKPLVNVFGSSSPDYWPSSCTPRHLGVLNVLFRNGTVQSFSPTDIDPRDSVIYQRSWLPTVPGPF